MVPGFDQQLSDAKALGEHLHILWPSFYDHVVMAVPKIVFDMSAPKAEREEKGTSPHAFYYRGNYFPKSPCRLLLSVHWPELCHL